MKYFVTAIGTDSGKTVVCALLCQALGAAYWKPIQCGFPTDLSTVKKIVTNKTVQFIDEQYVLKTPASPHAAARIEQMQLSIQDFRCPSTNNDLIIEGAGGLLVPINDTENIVDLISHFDAEVVLVANLYLGSINHTLMSVEIIKNRGLPVKGIIFNGPSNPESEEVILKRSGYRKLLHLPALEEINPAVIHEYAVQLKTNWYA